MPHNNIMLFLHVSHAINYYIYNPNPNPNLEREHSRTFTDRRPTNSFIILDGPFILLWNSRDKQQIATSAPIAICSKLYYIILSYSIGYNIPPEGPAPMAPICSAILRSLSMDSGPSCSRIPGRRSVIGLVSALPDTTNTLGTKAWTKYRRRE